MSSRPTRAEHVREAFLRELRSGRYVVGDKIPNETELAARFDVSRATIREAVLGLIEVGYLSRKHGLGTFVTGSPRHRHALDLTVSYTAMIRNAGMEPKEIVLTRGERPAAPEEAERLGIGADDPLVYIERVRTADGTPAVYSEDRIPARLLGTAADLPIGTSLYEFLAGAGITIHHALAALRPVIADKRLSRLLGVPSGAALQYIDQIDFTSIGVPAVLSSEWHVPGIFELCINRRPLAGGAAFAPPQRPDLP